MRESTFIDEKEIDKNMKGGYYYRAFDLVDFIKKIEATGKKVTGINFEKDSYNIEFLWIEEGEGNEKKNNRNK